MALTRGGWNVLDGDARARLWKLISGARAALMHHHGASHRRAQATSTTAHADARCVGFTVWGTRCSNPALPVGQLCRHHEGAVRPDRHPMKLWD